MYTPSSSTPKERSTESAPASPTIDGTIDVQLAPEDELIVLNEVKRLEQCSVVAQVLGKRPSRGDLRHLLQAALKEKLDKITDIQLMGRGCYQLEFEDHSSVRNILSIHSVEISGAWVLFFPWTHGFDTAVLQVEATGYFTCTAVFPGLDKEWREVLHKIGAAIGRVLHVNSSTFKDIVEKGGAPSVKLLCKKDAVLPNWIRLPKLQGNMFQKIQKVLYFGLPNQCFSCKKIGHLAKDCLTTHGKPIAAMNKQNNSVVTSLLPHETQQVKGFDTSLDKVGKGKSVDMICSNFPQSALSECSMDTLRQDLGMSVSAPSLEIIPAIPPPLVLPECSMDALQKDVVMPVAISSMEIVPVIDPILEQDPTKVKASVQKMITSFQHNDPKVNARSYSAVLQTGVGQSPYVFTSAKDTIEALGNSKNRVYKDHHVLLKDSRVEKRITRAVTSSQKERQVVLTDKRSSPSQS